ncbi:MAG: ABC transporter substrate-binding protein [Thermomicrobiales bacterium]
MVDERQVSLTKALMAHFESLGVSRRHFLKLLATAGAGASLSALIVACGGDDDDDDTSGGGDEEPTAASGGAEPTATSAEEEEEESEDEPTATTEASGGAGGGGETGVLVAASGQDISNLDPHTGHDYSIASTQKSVYDTLLRYQGNPPELEHVLATDYEANEDATEWTFTLDDRAVFHDGTPVTADDIVYNVGRLIRKNKGPAWMFTNFLEEDGAEAIDEHTVKLTLTSPSRRCH